MISETLIYEDENGKVQPLGIGFYFPIENNDYQSFFKAFTPRGYTINGRETSDNKWLLCKMHVLTTDLSI